MITPDDRYSRLLAAITARRDKAYAACADLAEPDDRADCEWVHDETKFRVHTRSGLGVVTGSVYVYLRHVAANDPAQVLRDTTAHLRIVERHQHRGGPGDDLCRCCKEWWPCPDWLDVASSYPEPEE